MNGWIRLLAGIVAVLGTGSCCLGQSITAEASFPVHLEAAQQYRLHAGDPQSVAFKLNEQPLFVWSNPRRAGGQVGHLFVWMDDKLPAAVATIFSFPWQGNPLQQRLVHELHALHETKLVSVNPAAVQPWAPTAGFEFLPLQTSVDVPSTAARRRLQVRQFSRTFQAHTIDRQNQRWPLRIMPKELMSYQGEEREGAMFALLGDAGGDPELLLLIEAKRSDGAWHWRYAPVRMTDQEIYLSIAGREAWTSTHEVTKSSFYNVDRTYFRFQDRLYDASALLEPLPTSE